MKKLFFYISAIHFEIATGLNLTDMRDEAKGDAAQTSTSHSVQPLPLVTNRFPLLLCPLSEDAVVVRGTGGLELEGDPLALLIKPVQGCFIIES